MDKQIITYEIQRELEGSREPQRKFATFEDNVYYHTTDGRYLPMIASKGLQPGDGRNWKTMVVGKAVYLWPNAGQAWSYREDLKNRGTGNMVNPLILRIENLDRNRLGPDHESFWDWLYQNVLFHDGEYNPHEDDRNSLIRDMIAASPNLQALIEERQGTQNWSDDYAVALRILTEVPPEIKVILAQQMSNEGNPLMYDGPINADHISVAKTRELTDEMYEEMRDKFEELHGGRPDDDEEEVWYEKFETWLYQQGDWITTEEFKEMLEEWYDDADDSIGQDAFHYEPLRQQYPDPSGQLSLMAATSEDTEPEGLEVGFLRDPHPTLYPCLWEGMKMKTEALAKLKAHVLNEIELEFQQPDQFIYFTMYGSGASFNWDESGDADIQMWVDITKFNELHEDEHALDQDDLVAAIRRIVQPINFPSFADLGLSTQDCKGEMLIQFYPKPGTGSLSENLSQKPYACYDMETNEWLVRPKPIRPQFYGDAFLMVEPKAQDIATQAEAAIDELQRNIVDWQFWYAMWSRYKNHNYKARFEEARDKAEQFKESIHVLFEGVFGGRADAYSEQGKGIEDERDITQKLLEVWGIFQRLKHFARAPLPWDEQELPVGVSGAGSDPGNQDDDQKNAHDQSIAGWSRVVKATITKRGSWQDIMEKAQKIRDSNGVQLTVNAPDHVVGTVNSGTEAGKQYDTEIWRDDPNSGSITQWNCSCPWSDYSWGRTRKWKKYEGRPCAHTLALYWTSVATPSNVDQQGNEQLQIPDQGQMNPSQPTPDSQIIPGQMPPGVTQESPNPLDWLTGPNVPGGANTPVIPLNQEQEIQTPPPLAQPGFSVPLKPGEHTQLEFPGTFSSWQRTSVFANGDMIRNKVPVTGEDRDGNIKTVPRNSVGEVLWSDDTDTICMFPLTQNGPLEPHLVRVENKTENFYLSPNMNAGPRRRR